MHFLNDVTLEQIIKTDGEQNNLKNCIIEGQK